jgi:hypothetical protein
MPLFNISGAKIATCLVPAVCKTTANATGTGVAVGAYRDITMIWMQGISLDTLSGSVYWTVTFEESDDNTTFTTIAASDLDNVKAYNTHLIDAAAEDPTMLVRRYKGSKAYVRMLGTQTGTHTNGTPLAAIVVLADPLHAPVTQETETGTASAA